MNSTALALLLITSLNALPQRSLPAAQEGTPVSAVSPLKATDQASRLAAKGRLPQDRLQLRLADHLALAAK